MEEMLGNVAVRRKGLVRGDPNEKDLHFVNTHFHPCHQLY